jgi:hypothetical protein
MHSVHSRNTSDRWRAGGVQTTPTLGPWCIWLFAVAAMVAGLMNTMGDGTFAVAAVTPGRYVLRVAHAGFRSTEVQGIVLNVDDRAAVSVDMNAEGCVEDVGVCADAHRINSSPAVSTVVARHFAEILPLNGRSLQALIELTPGVVLARVASLSADQFSVNGQRQRSNGFPVDGVGAKASISTRTAAFSVQHVVHAHAPASGQPPARTVWGTSNGLVSVDALQEFRIRTSGYAPEFGRTPGGQISLVTRSGTNGVHGSTFEYFRHDNLDANDWFVNKGGLEKPQICQHYCGAVLGGPILRNRAFFFASYEGLRLEQPPPATVNVPSVVTRCPAVTTFGSLSEYRNLPGSWRRTVRFA